MATISDTISTYISAKDGNRSWLMRRAFAKDACLEMVVNTDTISFPSSATGIDAITEVLIRQFNLEYENVYTLCLSSPSNDYDPVFSCNWLVGMSRRDNGQLRVGYGRYDWSFSSAETVLVDNLKITIETMQVLTPDHVPPVMAWLSELPYPWCSAKAAVKGLPELDDLGPILHFLRRPA